MSPVSDSPRARFFSYVRDPQGNRQVVSPFLPHPDVVSATLRFCGLDPGDDPVANEILLARELDYEPMFMTECTDLIFPWEVDEGRSTEDCEVSTIGTPKGAWERRVSRSLGLWGDTSGFPVKTEADHEMLALVCRQVADREPVIRTHLRRWRERVGDGGVIVLGHPHPSWLGYQVSPENIFLHWKDYPKAYCKSMEAVTEAALVVMRVALQEGIDFMSDSSYGLEMTSPSLFEEMDLPGLRRLSAWTHERGGLFWYHNCGRTRELIAAGVFDRIEADVLETIAPPPTGDNDLAESRAKLTRRTCSKGNLCLGLLRDGSREEVVRASRSIVQAVRGFPHIVSTADAVLPGTPPENFVAFVREAREGAA
jgi:hypothetical protein